MSANYVLGSAILTFACATALKQGSSALSAPWPLVELAASSLPEVDVSL